MNRFNRTSLIAVVTPTDSPKSTRKRSFGGVFCCQLVLAFSVGMGASVICLS